MTYDCTFIDEQALLLSRRFERLDVDGALEGANNTALRALAKMSRLIYDIYNNGLWNLGGEFRRAFGCPVAMVRVLIARGDWDGVDALVLPNYETVIRAAVAEQFLSAHEKRRHLRADHVAKQRIAG